jgi:hypothetical protein
MFRRLLRALDLNFGWTDRSRLAQIASATTGIPMGLMYDGGLDVQAEDILPLFRKGKPEIDALYVVGRVMADSGGAFFTFYAVYDHNADAWITKASNVGRKREVEDRWLQMTEYEDAYRSAVVRMRRRVALGY